MTSGAGGPYVRWPPAPGDVAVHDNGTAVVEAANICGLHTLPRGTLAPLTATSTGPGEAVRAVHELGARTIVVALGGSASTTGARACSVHSERHSATKQKSRSV